MARKNDATDVDIDSILNKINDLVSVFDTASLPDEAPPQAASESSSKKPTAVSFCEAQQAEIDLGRQQNLKTHVYAKDCYNWLQMRELRKGLLANVDTSFYENPLFTAPQMREIRLGLVDHLDVSSYARLLYSATDMRSARSELFARAYREDSRGYGRTIELKEQGITLRISDDYMKAFLKLTKQAYQDLDEESLMQFLSDHDLTRHLAKGNLAKILHDKPCDREICIAEGKQPIQGKSGWYELFFDNPLDKARIIQPDDEIDYSEIRMIDLVEPNQILATYHPVRAGKDGSTVTDLPIQPPEVRDLPTLTGKGFTYNAKTKTYYATTNGYPSFNASSGILSVCMVYEVRGDLSYYQNTRYDGNVHVYGSILNHATIHATGDVIVDGHMENGYIYSDQNVIIKGGVNGGGTGMISAGGSIRGKFFEYATLNAGGTVEGNYFLDCQIKTDDVLTVRGRKGRIMGGNIIAAVSVEAVTIGNYLSNKTTVKVGDLDDFEDRIYAQEQKKREIAEEIDQLNLGIQKLVSILGEDQAPKNALYNKTTSALEVKEEQLDRCDKEIAHLNLVMKRAQKAYVRVHSEIQENVMFEINGIRKRIEKPIKRGIILNKLTLHKNKTL